MKKTQKNVYIGGFFMYISSGDEKKDKIYSNCHFKFYHDQNNSLAVAVSKKSLKKLKNC